MAGRTKNEATRTPESHRNHGATTALLAGAVAVVALCGQAAQTHAQQHFCVAAGIDHDILEGTSDLSSCVNDANGFVDALLGDASRWNAENVQILTDSAATRMNIRNALYNMALSAGPNDVCVYFHSSHGGSYGGTSAYLCTYDEHYSDDELGADIAYFFDPGATVIVIVDACHSGGLFKDEASGKVVSPQTAWSFGQNAMAACQATRMAEAAKSGEPLLKDPAGNVGFLTACDYYESSWSGNPYSEFAGYVIEAFGLPEADANGDQQCSFWELFSWAAPRAQGQTAQSCNQPLLSRTVAARGSTSSSANTGRYRPELTPSSPNLCGAMGSGAPMLMTVGAVGLVGLARSSRIRRKR
ncbi:MAG: caspase family protein [Planctomycetota bacterium]